MDVYFANLLKKTNSTAQPNLTGITPNVCQLKAPCSVLKPVLELYDSSLSTHGSDVIKCNYAYIPDFHRYYYITNWTFDGNCLICSLEVDVLATYKTEIKASQQYVLRSGSNYSIYVTDAKYTITTAAPTRYLSSIGNPLQPAANDYGCFVLGILNNRASLTGCVTYYVMSYLVFMTFCSGLFTLSTNWGSSDTSVSDGVKKALTDPFQYVVSLIWLPYSTYDFNSRGFVSSITSAIPVGYDNVPITGTAYEFDASILNVQFTNLVSFTINKHPDRLTRGEWLNVAPYSRYYLSFYPCCGEIEIDSALLQGKSTLDLVYTVDLRTGKGVLNVCTDHAGDSYATWLPNAPLRVLEAQVGVTLPLASIHTVLPSSLGQVVKTAVGTVAGFDGFKDTFLKAYASLAQGVGKMLGYSEEDMSQVYSEIGAEPFQTGDISDIATNAAAVNSTAELIGSQGTVSFNSRMPLQFWSYHFAVADDGNAIYGRPLCQQTLLTNLTGFCQCGNPHTKLPANCYRSEVDMVNNYLATGLYLE